MIKYINGGLELKPSFASSSGEAESKKETGVGSMSNFGPVLSMLSDTSSEFDLITDSSLKGFIFKLDVQPGTSSYTEYNLLEKKQVEVTHFALKFVVISDTVARLPNLGPKTKETETEQSFIDEAKMQQDIWKQTYLTQGGEIAPSVGNITILKGRDTIINLLDDLIKKEDAKVKDTEVKDAKVEDTKVKAVLQFLKGVFENESNKEYKLGILLMKNYIECKTFHEHTTEYEKRGRNKNQEDFLFSKEVPYLTVRQNILIKVIRLALLGYIHLDLHGGNSLNTNESCVIIDYGRAVSIKDDNGKYTIDKYIEYIGENSYDQFRNPIGSAKVKKFIDTGMVLRDRQNREYDLKDLYKSAETLFFLLEHLGKVIKPIQELVEQKRLMLEKLSEPTQELVLDNIKEFPKLIKDIKTTFKGFKHPLEGIIENISTLDAFMHVIKNNSFTTKMNTLLRIDEDLWTLYDDEFPNRLFEELSMADQPTTQSTHKEYNHDKHMDANKAIKDLFGIGIDPELETKLEPTLERVVEEEETKTKTNKRKRTIKKSKSTNEEEEEEEVNKRNRTLKKSESTHDEEARAFIKDYNLTSGGKQIKKRAKRINPKFYTKRRIKSSKSKSKKNQKNHK